LCVVGDPNQAIYAWNGADPTLIGRLPSLIAGTTTVALEDNYRSSPQIVATANRVLDCSAARTLRLRATRREGPLPEVRSHASDTAEAAAVARAIAHRRSPEAPWSHHAVLTRTNAQAVMIAESLRAVGAPVRVRGQAPFLQLPEIQEALRSIRRSRAGLRDALAGLAVRVEVDDPDDEGSAPSLSDSELARVRNLEELLRLAHEYMADDPTPSPAGFDVWLNATVGTDDAGAGGDAVDIATFHAAKGLEWPVVHLTGLESGLVPIGHAQTNEAMAEERRLFYVAVTRAERELHLHWAEERTFGARVAKRRPSPLLDELEPLFDALRRGAAPANAADFLPTVRETVRRAPRAARSTGRTAPALTAGDQALFEELRRWRSQRAKAASVPAVVIFDDKTLTEVATRRPSSRDALLQVPGIGPVKVERYGDDLLGMIAGH